MDRTQQVVKDGDPRLYQLVALLVDKETLEEMGESRRGARDEQEYKGVWNLTSY